MKPLAVFIRAIWLLAGLVIAGIIVNYLVIIDSADLSAGGQLGWVAERGLYILAVYSLARVVSFAFSPARKFELNPAGPATAENTSHEGLY